MLTSEIMKIKCFEQIRKMHRKPKIREWRGIEPVKIRANNEKRMFKWGVQWWSWSSERRDYYKEIIRAAKHILTDLRVTPTEWNLLQSKHTKDYCTSSVSTIGLSINLWLLVQSLLRPTRESNWAYTLALMFQLYHSTLIRDRWAHIQTILEEIKNRRTVQDSCKS